MWKASIVEWQKNEKYCIHMQRKNKKKRMKTNWKRLHGVMLAFYLFIFPFFRSSSCFFIFFLVFYKNPNNNNHHHRVFLHSMYNLCKTCEKWSAESLLEMNETNEEKKSKHLCVFFHKYVMKSIYILYDMICFTKPWFFNE